MEPARIFRNFVGPHESGAPTPPVLATWSFGGKGFRERRVFGSRLRSARWAWRDRHECRRARLRAPGKRRWILVDCGLTFAGDEAPGVDLVYPNLAFLEKERKNLSGIVITHAHEDHIGALAALWPRLGVKVHATRFAVELMGARRLGEPGAPKIPLATVDPGKPFDIGPFTLEFIPVAHSIPESMALAIRTPAGLILHTGDWKIDPTPIHGAPTDEARLRALGDEGVLARSFAIPPTSCATV